MVSVFVVQYGACPNSALLTLLHLERPKLYAILAFLSATGLTANLQNCKCYMVIIFNDPHSIICSFEDLLLALLHLERPKLYAILAFLSATGLTANLQNCKCYMVIIFNDPHSIINNVLKTPNK